MVLAACMLDELHGLPGAVRTASAACRAGAACMPGAACTHLGALRLVRGELQRVHQRVAGAHGVRAALACRQDLPLCGLVALLAPATRAHGLRRRSCVLGRMWAVGLLTVRRCACGAADKQAPCGCGDRANPQTPHPGPPDPPRAQPRTGSPGASRAPPPQRRAPPCAPTCDAASSVTPCDDTAVW